MSSYNIPRGKRIRPRIPREDLLEMTAQVLKEKGAEQNSQAKLLTAIADELYEDDDPRFLQIKGKPTIRQNEAWSRAYSLVTKFLHDNEMKFTVETIDIELGKSVNYKHNNAIDHDSAFDEIIQVGREKRKSFRERVKEWKKEDDKEASKKPFVRPTMRDLKASQPQQTTVQTPAPVESKPVYSQPVKQVQPEPKKEQNISLKSTMKPIAQKIETIAEESSEHWDDDEIVFEEEENPKNNPPQVAKTEPPKPQPKAEEPPKPQPIKQSPPPQQIVKIEQPKPQPVKQEPPKQQAPPQPVKREEPEVHQSMLVPIQEENQEEEEGSIQWDSFENSEEKSEENIPLMKQSGGKINRNAIMAAVAATKPLETIQESDPIQEDDPSNDFVVEEEGSVQFNSSDDDVFTDNSKSFATSGIQSFIDESSKVDVQQKSTPYEKDSFIDESSKADVVQKSVSEDVIDIDDSSKVEVVQDSESDFMSIDDDFDN